MFTSFRVPPIASQAPKRSSASTSGNSPVPPGLVDARGHVLIACNTCRTRKLKCSGDRDACSRCRAAGTACVYAQVPRGPGIGRKRPRHTSSIASAATSDDEPSRTSDSTPSMVPDEDTESAMALNMAPGSAEQTSDRPGTGEMEVDYSQALISSEAQPEMNWDDICIPMTDDQYDFDLAAIAYESSSGLTSNAESLVTTPMPMSPRAGFDFPIRMSEAQPEQTHQEPAKASGAQQNSCPSNFECLRAVVQLLEEIGVQRAYAEATGLEGFLVCLRTSTRACNDILACSHCRLSTENPMLLATVAQQLGDVCVDMSELLAQDCADNGRGLPGGSTVSSAATTNGLLKGTIWFGSYNIETTGMRDALVRRLISFHLDDLRALLVRLRAEMGRKRGAWKLVGDAEDNAKKAQSLVRELDQAVALLDA